MSPRGRAGQKPGRRAKPGAPKTARKSDRPAGRDGAKTERTAKGDRPARDGAKGKPPARDAAKGKPAARDAAKGKPAARDAAKGKPPARDAANGKPPARDKDKVEAPSRGRGQMPPRGARPTVSGHVVALLERRGRFLTATPFFDRGRRITVEKSRHGLRVESGDLVLVEPLGPRAGHGKVVARIGRPDVARDVIEAFMYERGLKRRFDPAVEREARNAAAEPPDPLADGRRDLRDLPTFTIDPPTAKDYDDAISAERLDGGRIRIWVHIADVSAHVRPGSLTDKEAYRRATSTYVPGAVEPMLPEALSNVACSLVPFEDRLAVTVEMEYEAHKIVRSAFHRSVIRSDARMDYPQVDRIFAGSESADAVVVEPLAAAREVADALDEERRRRGALVVESSEPEFGFSHEGDVTDVLPAAPTESHRLIEHLMIAANEAVAAYLETHRVPALYRVHEPPDPPRVERLAAQLASLDIPTPPMPDHMTPQQAGDLAAAMSRLAIEHAKRIGHGAAAFSSLVLRSLKRAHYSPRNAGHAGLHSPRYCHFTSPIRRYPDLVCHRALLAGLGLGEERPEPSYLEGAGEWCSERERFAMQIERRADDIARCFLLQAELAERGPQSEWEGEVISVIESGAFIAFGDGHEGMLPVRRLSGDWWEINEFETMLVGSESGKRLRIGDPVTVQVESIDAPRGRVSLSPVEL